MVAIADLTAIPNDTQPAVSSLSAALAFARQRQSEGAERLAGEAVAMGKGMRGLWAAQ
jgi:hypothetical protein